MNRADVFDLINTERQRQAKKWASPHNWGQGDCSANLPATTKLAVLTEELGEVARAVLDHSPTDHLRDELCQVAAVATAWMESL